MDSIHKIGKAHHMATYAVGKEDGGIVDDDDAAEDDDDERNPVEG